MKDEFILKDSGERRKFDTGAVRDAEKDTRYDLMSTISNRKLAHQFFLGAKKYGDSNWRLGIPASKYIDSCKRHLDTWIDGTCTEEDHLTAALWNLYCLLDTMSRVEMGLLPESLNDLNIYKLNKKDGQTLNNKSVSAKNDEIDTHLL